VWCEKHFIQPCIKHTNLVLYCLKLLCVFLNRPFLSQGQILKRFPIIIYPKLFFYNSSKFMLGIQSLLQLVHLKPFRNIFLHMQWCNYCPHVLRYIKDDKVIYALIYLDLSVCATELREWQFRQCCAMKLYLLMWPMMISHSSVEPGWCSIVMILRATSWRLVPLISCGCPPLSW
jgi:hypothetical protein